MKHGIYIGCAENANCEKHPELLGESALIREDGDRVLAQFDNRFLKNQKTNTEWGYGWHSFYPEDFIIDEENEK